MSTFIKLTRVLAWTRPVFRSKRVRELYIMAMYTQVYDRGRTASGLDNGRD